MKKRFLPLSMLLITMVLAQASIVANAAGVQGKYTPRTGSKATFSSFMKSIRANQETGLIDPALFIAGQKTAQTSSRDVTINWTYAGPDNFGGFTKAIIYNNDGSVLIGTAGGDIYKSTNGGITFGKIASVASETYCPVGCMVKDANGNIYIGTGDGRDAQALNGLSVLGYETSFPGQGIFKMNANGTITHLDGTTPTATNGWGFVNDLTIANGKIYAATATGVQVSEDGGESWNLVVSGAFRSIKSNNSGDVMAADASNVFLSIGGGDFNNVTDGIASNSNPKIIAMSQSNANFMYIAYLSGSAGSYALDNIYYTSNHGESWGIAMGQSSQFSIIGSDADYDGFMIVYPNNPRKLLLGSDDLWKIEDITSTGVYTPEQISVNGTSSYSSLYVHQGIQSIVFNPSNPSTFFIGTNGGVFKGTYAQGVYTYTGSNRYYLTDNEHTSVARMMSVGVSGSSIVIGGNLDHGTFLMTGSELINNVTTGEELFPHPTNNGYASTYFTKDYAGGPCAVSTIDPFIMFVSGTGNLSTPIYRTQTMGVDFDANFEGEDGPIITNENAFKTPFALFENYNDANNPVDTLFAPIRNYKHNGDLVYAYSLQAGYAVDYYLGEPPHDADHVDPDGNYAWIPGDTIRGIHDPVSTLYLVGVEGKIYMTRESHIFNKTTDWLLISTIDGIPTAVAISGDGDMAMVGTAEGNLYKVTGLAHAYTAAQASVDSAACVVTVNQLSGFTGQAVTGISIGQTNSNNVLVSLGNYGNSAYVYLSTNGGSSFSPVQGNIPQVPAYSCLIEKTQGVLMVGTEYGLYVSDNNGSSWNKTSNISCPIMDLKQAVLPNHETKVDTLYDEMGTPTLVAYPGIFNYGMVYAATYGAGIISSNTFFQYTEGENPNDNDVTVNENEDLNVYPNPVRDRAQINIKLDNATTVSYVIYDLSGRVISQNNLGTYVKGTHTLNINTNDLSTGSYIIRINAGDKSETGKFLVY